MNDAADALSCSQCRVSSPLKSAFQVIGRGRKKRTLCPTCMREESHRQSQMTYIGLTFLLLLGSFVAAFGKTTNPGWMLINLALVTVMAWLSILPHEAGHAFVANLVGLGVDRIVIGIGRKVASVTLFAVPIEIHQYPAGGLTHVAIRDVPHMRWKWAAIVIAGPLVNFAFLWAAISWGEPAWRAERIEGGLAPMCAFIAANFLIIVANLWPARVGTDAGQAATDGAQLLALATGKPYDFAAAARAQQLARLHALFAKQRWQEVETTAHRMLQSIPDDYATQVTLSAALINLGKLQEGRELLEGLVERTPPYEWHGAVAANNLAWLYLLQDDLALADRAQELGAKAYTLLPWEPFITSTYAATQAIFGDADLAQRLLTTMRVRNNRNKTRASSLAASAIAYSRLGRHADSVAALNLAETIDPDAQLMSIARRLLNEPKHAGSPSSLRYS